MINNINIRTRRKQNPHAKKIKSTRVVCKKKIGGTKRMENVKPCNIQTSVVTHLNIKHM